jgi:predicted metal-dependent hydrolase
MDAVPTVAARLYSAVARFNEGAFFEAHEAFEELLDAVEGDERWDLFVALIQVAVGYHKWAAGLPGSARMLRLGAEKLAAFADVVAGIQVGALRRRVLEDAALAAAEPDGWQRLAAFPPRIEMA